MDQGEERNVYAPLIVRWGHTLQTCIVSDACNEREMEPDFDKIIFANGHQVNSVPDISDPTWER
jgi:hypothetical protein